VAGFAARRLHDEWHVRQQRVRQQLAEGRDADRAGADRLVPVPLGPAAEDGVVGVHQLHPPRAGHRTNLGQHRLDPARRGQVVPGGEQVAGVEAYPGLRVPLEGVKVPAEVGRAGAQHLPLPGHRLQQEVGAAVANAVPSLAAQADLRLESPDGAGVAELLTGPLLAGQQRLCPKRRWLQVGTFDDGQPVLVPGSQGSILIAGGTGAGKSYLAGLLAERWIDAGYAVLIIDPEGDHVGLAQRPGVHLVDAAAHLPGPTDLLAIARPGRASLILDLSGATDAEKSAYLRRLPSAIAAERAEHGIPHWVITDEAHLALQEETAQPAGPGLAEPGTCLVTWRADILPAAFRDSVDMTLTVTVAPPASANAPMAGPRATVSVGGQRPRPFTIASRVSPHVRHQHKYTSTALPSHRRFYFRASDEPGGEPVSAATMEEFSRHIRHCDPAVLDYHLSRGDFSRWITGTFADRSLGSTLAAIERDVSLHHAADLERARHRIVHAIDSRYPGTREA